MSVVHCSNQFVFELLAKCIAVDTMVALCTSLRLRQQTQTKGFPVEAAAIVSAAGRGPRAQNTHHQPHNNLGIHWGVIGVNLFSHVKTTFK